MKVSKYTIPLKLEEDHYLLINSRTGAVDLVDEEALNLLQGEKFEADSSAVHFFKERGHLTELTFEEEVEQIENTYKKYMETHTIPSTHTIIPTYNCNLKCPYCFLSHLRTKDKSWLNKVIDHDQVDALFEVITEIDGSHRGQIAFYGGEPLLVKNKSIIEAILSKGARHGYTFSIPTNGVSVTDYIDILKKYEVTIQITIDGPEHIHDTRRIKKDGSGTFDEIVAGVDAALDAGLTVFLRINLDQENLDSLTQVTDFYTKKGWYDHPKVSMHFSPIFYNPCGRNDWYAIPRTEVYQNVISQTTANPEIAKMSFDFKGVEMFENIFLKGELGPPRFWFCEANTNELIYDPFGDIYVCAGQVGEKSMSVGTYYPELTWNSNLKAWRERTVFTIPECRKCTYALFCGGGCGLEALRHYNTLSKPVCNEYPDVFHTVIPHMYKTVRKNHETESI